MKLDQTVQKWHRKILNNQNESVLWKNHRNDDFCESRKLKWQNSWKLLLLHDLLIKIATKVYSKVS